MKIRKLLTALMLLATLGANAQNADKLYAEGKQLYDAENYKAAFPKLKAAAAKGHKKAQYRMGRCYDKGRGVEENDTVAFQWYVKSALQHYAKAQYHTGKAYLTGRGVAADRDKAKTWLKRAVKNPKGGDKLLKRLRSRQAEGDEEAITMLKLVGK